MMNFTAKSLTRALLLGSALLAALPLQAGNNWNFDDAKINSRFTDQPYYYYVAKGEQWNNIVYKANFQTDNNATLIVNYDDRPIYRTSLTGQGTLSIPIPSSTSGYHRLNFIIQQYSTQDKNNLCQEEPDQFTTLNQSLLSYDASRSSYHLSDLPDALYNPQVHQATPLTASLNFDKANIVEAAMLARLFTAWNSNTEIQWVDHTLIQTQPVNFNVVVQHSATKMNGASVALTNEGSIPTLTITYSTAAELESAVNGLMNPTYLDQINNANAVLPATLAAPQWATLKTFQNLADLGVQDFRLDQATKNMSLNFPAVWLPTDILQGQIALRSQSGLLEGSGVTAWVNNALAGSLKLSELESDPVERSFNFFGKNISPSNAFDLRVESSIIANSNCIPSARGSLWIDATKSKITLPYKLKNGVVAVSSALATAPNIAIDSNSGSLGMAIVTAQVAKKMLMTPNPLPLNIQKFDYANPQLINIRVNKEIYNQQVNMHQDTIYAPSAAHGFFIIYQKDRFNIIADDEVGAQNFMHLWPKIQNNIPNNTTKVFVSAQGNVYALQQLIVGNQKAPIVQQSNFFLLIVVISVIFILAILYWYWRKRKNAKS